MSAYALYQDNKYDESIVAADRFIQLHPGHRDVAYAYYLKALDYYIQIADVGRDQKTTQQALDALGEVVRRFPDSRYAPRRRAQDAIWRATISPARRWRSAASTRNRATISRRSTASGAWSINIRPRPTCPRRWSA